MFSCLYIFFVYKLLFGKKWWYIPAFTSTTIKRYLMLPTIAEWLPLYLFSLRLSFFPLTHSHNPGVTSRQSTDRQG